MRDLELLIEAIAETAGDWQDPDFEPRSEAVEQTMEAENTFTEEAVAFAVNQQMRSLSADALRRWLRGRGADDTRTIGVLSAGNVPFVGLQDFLAVLLTGHRYVGSVSSRSPALLPAFAADLSFRVDGIDVDFDDAERLFGRVDAVVAAGSDETASWVAEQCAAHEIPPERRLIRGHRFSVAVIDGNETSSELESLAEDALLHEGFGCRNIAVIWAPESLSPDELLDAFAHFRAVFPAHRDTPGRLKMQQAFLEAVDEPHAYGEGLEFLLSKGDPEVQPPGHIRWTEYETLDAVNRWLSENEDRVQLIAARSKLYTQLVTDTPVVALGEAQRPPVDWCPDGRDTIAFLSELA